MRHSRLLVLLPPLVVGLVSLVITAWLWRHEQDMTRQALKADFDFSVRQTASRVEQRLAGYEQMLRGLQGLFRASSGVMQPAFEQYVDALAAGADFAGIEFFAYASRQAAGVAGRDTDRSRVEYLAPTTAFNLRLVGNDLHASALSRAALLLAGDSGGLGITPQLPGLIVRDGAAQPGLLMALPVYAPGQGTRDIEQRRGALVGWVMTGLRVRDLMSSLYGEGRPGIEVRIYEGLQLTPEALMYSSAAEGSEAGSPPQFQALEYVAAAGHTWTLVVSAGSGFAQRSGADSAQVILWSGVGLSLLLSLLLYQLASGRERARQAAIAMTREFRASEERYRRIVETADEGIWLTDAEGRTSFVNPKLTQLLGWSGAELSGRHVDELVEADGIAAPAAVALDAAGPHERRFRRRDGTPLWVSMTSTPIFDQAGRRSGSLAMVTDITARKQADAARLDLELQLRESQKLEAIGTLAGGIAHDFNNILAAILGHVALARLQAGQAADEGLMDNLDQIGRAGERARSLVQQILAFSRKQPHRLVAQPLLPVVEESVRLLRPLLPALARLELSLDSRPMTVLADATQLQQVMLNLCTNAWHALEGRAGCICIGLAPLTLDEDASRRLALHSGVYAVLSVSDDGSGMDEATRLRVFEPFFTTKPVGRGTGLGLAVVHGIVATHRGAIAVHSAPGAGARFEVFLPLIDEPATQLAAGAAEAPPAGHSNHHLVYVDDDPAMCVMVEALLTRMGLRVSTFEDPSAALAFLRLQGNDVALVVTDYNMPGLSGLDVAGELATLRPGLPVVISSGYVSDEMLAAVDRAGVRQVLQKEFTLEQLPGIVNGLLARRGVDAP